MLIDDAWINDTYGYSPIDQDLHLDVQEDEQIFRLMEEKFHVPREQIGASLRADFCDENTAMYHLLYHEKYFKKGGLLDGVAADSPPNLDIIQIHNPRAASPAPTNMVAIDENKVQDTPLGQQHQQKLAVPEQAQVRDVASKRVRPMTWVGGETSVTKFIQEQQQKSALGADGANSAPGSGSTSSTTGATATHAGSASTANANAYQSSTAGHGVSRRASSNAPPSISAIKAATESAGRLPPADENASNNTTNSVGPRRPSTATSTSANAPSPLPTPAPIANTQSTRQRRASMIGVFRNPLRRLSELPGTNESSGITSAGGSNTAASQQTTNSVHDEKPRSLRFTFNSNTTSTKQPDILVQEVLQACTEHSVKALTASRYVVECVWNEGKDKDEVKFDVEVCELPRLNGGKLF